MTKAAEIEITKEMIEAGALVLSELLGGASTAFVAKEVFLAMAAVRRWDYPARLARDRQDMR